MSLREAISKLEELQRTNGPATANQLVGVIVEGLRDIEARLPGKPEKSAGGEANLKVSDTPSARTAPPVTATSGGPKQPD